MSDLTNFLLASINGAKEPQESKLADRLPQPKGVTEQPLSALKLKPPVHQALMLAGIHTVEQLLSMTGADLLVVPGIDVAAAAELKKIQGQVKSQPRGLAPRRTGAPSAGSASAAAQAPLPATPGRSLGVLDLPAGYVRALERCGIRTVDDLCRVTMRDLVDKFRLGAAAGRVIQRAVERKGLTLADRPPRSASVASGTKVPSAELKGRNNQLTSDSRTPTPHPNGPRKWLDLAFASLSKTERHVLVAVNGLDGKGVREIGAAASEIGLERERAFRTELMAKARLRHTVVTSRRAPLTQLYRAVILGKDRACTPEDLATAVGYPDSGDGYDPLAFTRFILPLCEGLYQVVAGRWDVVRQRSTVVDEPAATTNDAATGVEGTSPAPNLATIRLAQIRRMEARLVALVAALAAQESCSVDFRRLKDFAESAGLRLTKTASIDVELGEDGVWLETSQPGELRLKSSHKFVLAPTDLPGKLTDLAFLRTVLPKVGVLRKAAGGGANFPTVELVAAGSAAAAAAVAVQRPAAEPEYPPIRLGSLKRNETKLAVLAATLAAELGGMLDGRQLRQFADGAAIYYSSIRSISGFLTQAGVEHEEPVADHFRLAHPYRITLMASDLPGRLGDPEFMRQILPRVGVIKPMEGTTLGAGALKLVLVHG